MRLLDRRIPDRPLIKSLKKAEREQGEAGSWLLTSRRATERERERACVRACVGGGRVRFAQHGQGR